MLQNNNNANASISHGGELKILERDGINPGSNDSLRLAVCTESPDIFFYSSPNCSLHAGTHVQVHGLVTNIEIAVVIGQQATVSPPKARLGSI